MDVLDATQTLSTQRIIDEHAAELAALLSAVDPTALHRIVETLQAAREGGGTVFIAGNGGSASTATHLANDLCKATRSSRYPPVRALSLTDNTSWVTALANDEGYDRIFAGQIENLAHPGDVMVAISASGNSENLIVAVEVARSLGTATCALLGFDGGALLTLVDEAIWLPTDSGRYASVEDAHSALCHVLTLCMCER